MIDIKLCHSLSQFTTVITVFWKHFESWLKYHLNETD